MTSDKNRIVKVEYAEILDVLHQARKHLGYAEGQSKKIYSHLKTARFMVARLEYKMNNVGHIDGQPDGLGPAGEKKMGVIYEKDFEGIVAYWESATQRNDKDTIYCCECMREHAENLQDEDNLMDLERMQKAAESTVEIKCDECGEFWIEDKWLETK